MRANQDAFANELDVDDEEAAWERLRASAGDSSQRVRATSEVVPRTQQPADAHDPYAAYAQQVQAEAQEAYDDSEADDELVWQQLRTQAHHTPDSSAYTATQHATYTTGAPYHAASTPQAVSDRGYDPTSAHDGYPLPASRKGRRGWIIAAAVGVAGATALLAMARSPESASSAVVAEPPAAAATSNAATVFPMGKEEARARDAVFGTHTESAADTPTQAAATATEAESASPTAPASANTPEASPPTPLTEKPAARVSKPTRTAHKKAARAKTAKAKAKASQQRVASGGKSKRRKSSRNGLSSVVNRSNDPLEGL